MKRLLCGWVVLGLLGGAGMATAQSNYSYTLLDVPGSVNTLPHGINDAGEVVGLYGDPNSDRGHGFLYSGGTYTTLVPPGSYFSDASGINDAGQIVGLYNVSQTGFSKGFLLTSGTYSDIVPPGASFNIQATGINNAGQIVGYYGQTGSPHAFLFDNGSYTSLDQPGSTDTDVLAINNAGQILGESSRGQFLLTGGTYTPLNLLGGATGFNDVGQIVGLYQDGVHGFLLSDGVYTLLAVPGAEATRPVGINNSGQIVGNYIGADGHIHGFLATPVPEPSTLLLLAMGTLGLIGWVWRCEGRAV
jgi:probable HAF family extracellular repeat protein